MSAWRLLEDELACTELVLLTLNDDDDGCGEDADITLLMTFGDGVISSPCVFTGACGVWLCRCDNVVEESSATGSLDVAGDTGRLTSASVFGEGGLAVLLRQPMGMIRIREIELDL